jgi:hypothetical protein
MAKFPALVLASRLMKHQDKSFKTVFRLKFQHVAQIGGIAPLSPLCGLHTPSLLNISSKVRTILSIGGFGVLRGYGVGMYAPFVCGGVSYYL